MSAFSSGTEFADWQAKWCEYCTHDHDIHDGNGSGCPIVLDALMDPARRPEQWKVGDGYGTERVACTEFEPCVPCGGDPAQEERAEFVKRMSGEGVAR